MEWRALGTVPPDGAAQWPPFLEANGITISSGWRSQLVPRGHLWAVCTVVVILHRGKHANRSKIMYTVVELGFKLRWVDSQAYDIHKNVTLTTQAAEKDGPEPSGEGRVQRSLSGGSNFGSRTECGGAGGRWKIRSALSVGGWMMGHCLHVRHGIV